MACILCVRLARMNNWKRKTGRSLFENDPHFEIGAVYHKGIARFHDKKNERHENYDTNLGRTNAHGNPDADREVLKTSFSTIDDAKKLLNESSRKKGLMSSFKRFLEAAVMAKDKGRLGKMKRLTVRDGHVPGFTGNNELRLQILGPVPTSSRRTLLLLMVQGFVPYEKRTQSYSQINVQ